MKRLVKFFLDPGAPRVKTRHIFLGFLLLGGIFGVVNYNLLGADPEGDGGGTRFVFLCLLGLIGCIFDGIAEWLREHRARVAARRVESGSASVESAAPASSGG
jgi:hypothetical protein